MNTTTDFERRINDRELRKFEEDHGELPQEFKQFMLRNNGGYPNRTKHVTDTEVVYLQRIFSIKHGALTIEHIIDVFSDPEFPLPEGTIPFGIDPTGNLFMFKGNSVCIYFQNDNNPALYKLSDSFNSFMETLQDEVDEEFEL
ncbi:MAG: SMI1/KNR4 family protein [Crocinitomicaceae bacterium]|nr:SMI1/KNR4 family protein [Crocinitomicaceae bacterium]